MIRQEFIIEQYDWRVLVYYYISRYNVYGILDDMARIECSQDCLEDARENMEKGLLNSGFCYSNPQRRETVIVIAKTTSAELFVNSWMHEAKHLLSHIELEFNIDPYSEEAAYLCGYIGQKMYKVSRLFLCKCHLGKLYREH